MKNKTNTITAAQVSEIIREFADGIEAKRMTKDQVNDLRSWIANNETVEEGRILIYCEIENLKAPESGEFETLESFKSKLKEEGVI